MTPATRKVLLRTAMVMSRERGGPFDLIARVARWGLGGPYAGGAQYMSWIHEMDFARAVAFLIEGSGLSGPFNLAAPNPLPQREFMAALREAAGVHCALPATRRMLEAGTVALRRNRAGPEIAPRRASPAARSRFRLRAARLASCRAGARRE